MPPWRHLATMRDWLAMRARATPTATALVDARSGEERTYAALDARVEELAGTFAALGVGVDDHLGVVAPPGATFVEVVHAAMRLGAVLVPLHERFTATELADRGAGTDLSAVVCDRTTEQTVVGAFRARPSGTDGHDGPSGSDGHDGSSGSDDDGSSGTSGHDGTRSVRVVSVDEPTAGATAVGSLPTESVDVPSWRPDATQVLLPTSGTTGEPKVVALTTGNLLYSAAASSWHLGVLPSDRWYCVLPMSHMGGLAPVYRSVLYGTAVVVTGSGEFDAPRALDEMRTHDVTAVSLVPATFSRLLDAGEVPDSLRFVLLGGAPASEALVERALDRGVQVCPTYGTTETASQVATVRPGEAAAAPGSVGHPLLFVDVTIVDEDGSPVQPGDPGQLVVSGATVSPGYYGAPDATDEAFGPRGFHTGDVGYRDAAGRIHVVDRLDDRIVTGGENVDPAEVAEVLREHPAVEDAFVTGLPDETYGQRVAAVVAGDVTPAELDSHARTSLAAFKRPREWAVVDELPRTVSGTVDRDAARTLLGGE